MKWHAFISYNITPLTGQILFSEEKIVCWNKVNFILQEPVIFKDDKSLFTCFKRNTTIKLTVYILRNPFLKFMIIKAKYIPIILHFVEYIVITFDILIHLRVYKENKLQE